jgi:Carboxylesterase family
MIHTSVQVVSSSSVSTPQHQTAQYKINSFSPQTVSVSPASLSPKHHLIMKIQTLLVALAALSLPAYAAQTTSPTAKILNVTYSGTHNFHYNVDSFLGVPYAQPPLKSLRYRQPQALNTSWTEVEMLQHLGISVLGMARYLHYACSNSRRLSVYECCETYWF